jgi:hypothetical protein
MSHYLVFYKYQVEPEIYGRLLEEQGGKCAICGNNNGGKTGKTRESFRLAVDHNHITGELRGLLCSSCNMALGKFNDDVTLLHCAIEYLNSYSVGKIA